MPIKLTQERFIEKSQIVHGDRYGYSLVDYKNYKIPVKIICPIHGVFEQKPGHHIRGNKCYMCNTRNGNIKVTQEEFIKRCKEIHGDRYDYSLTEYKNRRTNIKIICPIHGVFEQKPGQHLSGQNCRKCYDDRQKSNTEEFIIKARKIHGDRYDYSLVDYKTVLDDVKIICPDHGKFKQNPSNHLKGRGCIKCSVLSQTSDTEEFIIKARKIHGDRYDYSLVEYVNAHTKGIIICLIHGQFEQTPNKHLNGRGCPTCAKSSQTSKGEREVISYIQSIYSGTILPNDRTAIKPYELDGYMPDINKAVEFNGTYTHGDKRFYFGFGDEIYGKDIRDVWERDELKAKMCKDLGIKLLVIWEYDWIYNREWCEQMIYNHILIK